MLQADRHRSFESSFPVATGWLVNSKQTQSVRGGALPIGPLSGTSACLQTNLDGFPDDRHPEKPDSFGLSTILSGPISAT